MRTPDEIRAQLEGLRTEIRDLSDRDELSDDDEARFDTALDEHDTLVAELEQAEARAARVAEVRAAADAGVKQEAGVPDTFNVIVDRGDVFDLSTVRSTVADESQVERELTERARRVIGEQFDLLAPVHQETAEYKVRTVAPEHGYSIARHVLRTSSPAYISAWQKAMAGRHYELTDEERAALVTAEREYAVTEGRAATAGTAASGGNLVPTILDPTVIISNAGASNPFREISNIKTVININGWTGVTSEGVTASWDTEAAEVSDDAAVFAQPNVPVHKASAFVPGSIEAFEDIPTLVSEVGMMFADAKDRLEEAAFATGSGTNQPTGIVTSLIGGPNYTAMATNSAFAIGDVFSADEALGSRYQRNAKWVMNRVHLNDIREMGGTSYYTRTVTLDSLALGEVLGKPTYESTTMSSTLDGDTNNNIVYGDFNGYVIADRVGLRTEFIPHLFATGNNRPSGSRGLYAHWRVGADSVNDTGFVLLYNPST